MYVDIKLKVAFVAVILPIVACCLLPAAHATPTLGFGGKIEILDLF